MLQSLKFVQYAVARKNFQPALTHYRIKDGRVIGFNGVIALSAPIDLTLETMPKAEPFAKAVALCNNATTTIHMTDGGRLAIRSGKFKAYIECSQDGADVLDSIQPEGDGVEIPGIFVQGLRVLEPFVGIDASRPWATGVLLRGRSAYATNNIVLAEYWLGAEMPDINIPSQAIRELLRIGEEPCAVQLSENSITFFFEGDRWMRSQLLGTSWPDIESILNTVGTGTLLPFPPGLFEAVETIKPFVGDEGRIYFRDGVVSTSREDGEGASQEVEGLPERGAYHVEHLLSLNGIANAIDFSFHPQPCPFQGDRLRGVMIGMVDA